LSESEFNVENEDLLLDVIETLDDLINRIDSASQWISSDLRIALVDARKTAEQVLKDNVWAAYQKFHALGKGV
jgi:hypothetical protein